MLALFLHGPVIVNTHFAKKNASLRGKNHADQRKMREGATAGTAFQVSNKKGAFSGPSNYLIESRNLFSNASSMRSSWTRAVFLAMARSIPVSAFSCAKA